MPPRVAAPGGVAPHLAYAGLLAACLVAAAAWRRLPLGGLPPGKFGRPTYAIVWERLTTVECLAWSPAPGPSPGIGRYGL